MNLNLEGCLNPVSFGMIENFSHNLETIPTDRIDSKERLFSVSLPWLSLDQLTRSIHRNGLLSPLHLQKRAHAKFRIVIGFRRYQAARNLGFQALPCVIRDERNPLVLYRQALEDNLTVRPLHLMEKARVLLKLHRDFEVDHQILMDEYLPLLGIRPDRFHLRQQFDLASLSLFLQRAVSDLLEPGIALKMSPWKSEEQRFFFDLVSEFQLGGNKQNKLFTLLDEIQASRLHHPATSPEHSRQVSIQTIWQQSGAAEKAEDKHLPLQERFEQALKKLFQLRFPHLSQHEKRYAELKAALKFPPQVQLRLPPNFEGNQVNVSLSARDLDELLALTEKLHDAAREGGLKQIFDLL